MRGPTQSYGGRGERHDHHKHHEHHEHRFHHPDGPGRGWGEGRVPGGARFPGGGFGGGGFGGGGGGPRRARRGDIRAAVLAALADGPAHGYEVIRRLEQRSGGLWRPSPGSVYPMLQLLEDEGLTRGGETDGRRTYELTDEGRAEAERRSAAGTNPWASDDPAVQGQLALREAVGQLHAAAGQVGSAGSADQIERATATLRQARQALYTILAES